MLPGNTAISWVMNATVVKLNCHSLLDKLTCKFKMEGIEQCLIIIIIMSF